jgi:nitrogen-specific signal transduction histidine kinase/ActR/RegA family two-component response regulator
VQGIGRDVTQRRELESELRQAQRLDAVGRLAGGVAHDFNNLLTVVVGRAQLLLRALPAKAPGRRHVQLIHETAERAAALIQQLLAFSRRTVLKPEILDLNIVTARVEPVLRRLIGEHIDLRTDLDPALGQVEADPNRMTQIILTLAVNARDAMPQGGRLTIATDNVELDEQAARAIPGSRPGRYVRLVVSDSGRGMDADTLAHVFEPFFTTKGRSQGAGLGLAAVYGIVTQSGGAIAVRSRPGQGARFEVFLPRTDAVAEPAPPAEAAASPRRGVTTILLVEDEEVVRNLAREMLEIHGYTVLEARQGREALAVGQAHPGPIDLLLTDVVMPQMGGRELADRLVALRPGIPVLFMSGYTDDALVDHGVLDPSTTLLNKPFAMDQLIRAVQDMLDGARAAKT